MIREQSSYMPVAIRRRSPPRMARCEVRLIDPFTNGHGLGERLKHFMRFCRSRVLPPPQTRRLPKLPPLAWHGQGRPRSRQNIGEAV